MAPAMIAALGDADLERIRKTPDGRLAGPDLVAVLLGQRRHSGTPWKRLCEAHPEIGTSSSIDFFGRKGGKPTPVVDLKTAVKIIMVLPGPAAAAAREPMARTICRYLGGDQSLIPEIMQLDAAQRAVAGTGHAMEGFRQYAEAAQPTQPADPRLVDAQIRALDEELQLKRAEAERKRKYDEEEAERKRRRHDLALQQSQDLHAQELQAAAAKASREVEESLHARLLIIKRKLEDGFIDEAQYERELAATRPRRADEISIYDFIGKTLRGNTKLTAAVVREMTRLVESGEHPKAAADRDRHNHILWFAGADAARIREVYQAELDRRNGVDEQQQRLSFSR